MKRRLLFSIAETTATIAACMAVSYYVGVAFDYLRDRE